MRLVPITIKVERELVEKLDLLAKRLNRNRSVIVREALEKYFENIGITNERVIGNTNEPIGNTHGQTIGITDGQVIGNTHEPIGSTKNLGLQEKVELLKQLGIELLEVCREQKNRLREEYPNVSLYEIYKHTDCPKVKKAISELFRMSVET